MNPIHLAGKAAGQNALLTFSHYLEETHPTVSTNYLDLNRRITDLEVKTGNLEFKLDETYKTAQKIQGAVDGLGKTFADKIDGLKEEIKTETSAARTVTWPPLMWLLGLMVTGIIGVAIFFYVQLLSEKIETGISNSKWLSTSFATFNKHFEDIDGTLKEIRDELKGFKTSRLVGTALRDAVSGDEGSVAKKLPEVKALTQRIITEKIRLESRDYKEISETLANHYTTSKPPLQHQLWESLIDLANARSSTDGIIHPLSDAEIAEAKATNAYFENAEIDLSDKTKWDNAIFKNCKIKLSQPLNDLVLTNVRFVECEFQLETENWSARKLLEDVLENEGSQISSRVLPFSVSTPRGKIGKPLNPPSSSRN